MRHREVAREQIVERRYVGRALDRGVASQREDAAPGTADVSEQELEDARRSDVLRADVVLRPSDGVAEGARALSSRAPRKRLGDKDELLARDAADPFDHLGRVAPEV